MKKEQGTIERMRELLGLMSLAEEAVFDNNISTTTNSDKLNQELERIKNLGTKHLNEDFKEGYGAGIGAGKTVNSFLDSAQNPDLYKGVINKFSTLTDEEVLDIAIKRTVASGQPINDTDFYEEVNWNLMNFGFASKNSVDIKNALVKFLK